MAERSPDDLIAQFWGSMLERLGGKNSVRWRTPTKTFPTFPTFPTPPDR
jgi:hypothetical protein